MARALNRTVWAAILLGGALAALLVAWFVAGWSEVRTRQRDALDRPAHEATARGVELAHDLRAELGRLVTREAERPYFHYQNLFHDPRSGGNWSVAPSPLASGPEDPLVLGYFQIDAKGVLTTPTINDEVPEMSEPRNYAANQRFRDAIVESFLTEVTPTLVASADPPKAASSITNSLRSFQIDSSSYAQNTISSRVYLEQNNRAPRSTTSDATPRPVTITVSPLEWRTFTYGTGPALVGLRHVDTPDGKLAQGFVIDRSALTTWIADHAGDAVAELATTAPAGSAEIVPGWQLVVTANPSVLAASASSIASISRGFVIRFVLVGTIALAAAMLVVMLVSRAERLAQERSQFAAAAAHELRTPLAGLQLYGDMLADGLGDPAKLRDYARRMSEEASRLGRVVSNVLGFSQLERGNLAVDAKPGPLGEALFELAERAEPALDRAGAMLEVDVPRDLRAVFDRDAVARVVGNLLDNAEKYSRTAEDRTITLAARQVDAFVEVSVTDRGPGIDAATRAKLFKAFSRGVTADGPAGLGLGLALSRSLAEAMGGQLLLQSASPTGTTFVLRCASA